MCSYKSKFPLQYCLNRSAIRGAECVSFESKSKIYNTLWNISSIFLILIIIEILSGLIDKEFAWGPIKV